MKLFLKNLGIQIIIILISLFLVEFILIIINSDMNNYDIEMWRYAKELKMPDNDLGHIHQKNKSAILQNVEININSDGMRSFEKDKRNKILFIGSSISLGWGVKFEKTYPQLIQSKLDKDSTNYQILNGSVGNYNTFRYVNNFLKNQKDISPKWLIINYFINDAEILNNKSSSWILKNSQLASTIYITLRKLLSKSEFDLKLYYKDLYEKDSKGLQEVKKSLLKLSEYSKTKNIKVLLTIIPDIHFLEDYPFTKIHDDLGIFTKNLGFEFYDLLKTFEGIPFKKLQIIKGDSHPNEFGHKLISDSLYYKMKRSGLKNYSDLN